MKKTYTYIGTLGRRDGRAAGFSAMCRGGGVYAFEFREDGSLEPAGFVEGIETSMLAVSPTKNVLYSTNECRDFGGEVGTGGGISAYSVDAETGALTLINSALAGGSCTAYAAVSPSGRYVLVANHGSHFDAVCSFVPNGSGGFEPKLIYDTPSVAAFRLREDGGIDRMTDLVAFSGAGSHHPAPFIHSVSVDADNFVYACNKGLNTMELLRLDEASGKFEHVQQYQYRPGTSPRHSALSEKRPLIYVCNEMEPSVTVYSIDREKGGLCDVQCLPTVPGSAGMFGPSDIVLHPTERWLYVTNRGHNSIACFAVGEDGLLEHVDDFKCGANPRGFRIDPSGRFLLAGYMDDDRVATLAIGEDGKLTEVASATVPSPCSMRFLTL